VDTILRKKRMLGELQRRQFVPISHLPLRNLPARSRERVFRRSSTTNKPPDRLGTAKQEHRQYQAPPVTIAKSCGDARQRRAGQTVRLRFFSQDRSSGPWIAFVGQGAFPNGRFVALKKSYPKEVEQTIKRDRQPAAPSSGCSSLCHRHAEREGWFTFDGSQRPRSQCIGNRIRQGKAGRIANRPAQPKELCTVEENFRH